MEVDVMDIGDPQGSLRMRNRLERRKPGMPCRCASNSLPSGGMDHGMTMIVIQEGLPSEQTGLRFASFSFN